MQNADLIVYYSNKEKEPDQTKDNVSIKTKPKEIVFYESKTNEKFRKEFLYLSLVSNSAEFRV